MSKKFDVIYLKILSTGIMIDNKTYADLPRELIEVIDNDRLLKKAHKSNLNRKKLFQTIVDWLTLGDW